MFALHFVYCVLNSGYDRVDIRVYLYALGRRLRQ